MREEGRETGRERDRQRERERERKRDGAKYRTECWADGLRAGGG